MRSFLTMAGPEEQGVLAGLNEKTRLGQYINNLFAPPIL